MKTKKEAAVLAHRDLKEVREIQAGHALTNSLPAVYRKVKQIAAQMGCVVCALMAFEFLCAPWDPGIMSLSAGWTLAGVSAWACRKLYQIAGGEE